MIMMALDAFYLYINRYISDDKLIRFVFMLIRFWTFASLVRIIENMNIQYERRDWRIGIPTELDALIQISSAMLDCLTRETDEK